MMPRIMPLDSWHEIKVRSEESSDTSVRSTREPTRVSIVTFPVSHAIPLVNLVNVLHSLSNEIHLISGGPGLKNSVFPRDTRVTKIDHNPKSGIISRMYNYALTQLRISHHVYRTSGNTDLFIFFIGGESLVLPMLVLKLLRRKVILMPGGIAEKIHSAKRDPLTGFLSLLVIINLCLADRLVVYSSMLSQEGNLERYRHKTLTAHEHFVDFTRFRVGKRIAQRADRVGYIGRFSEEKGVLNLIEAVPSVLKKLPNTCFIICGKGHLREDIERALGVEGTGEHLRLMNWIAHEDVPHYLNELKLLVLPSLTEGLPNIILEAMACGTPVLATPVGAIPDKIKDGENGFLLKSNDPQHIADRIVELLSKWELLEKVSENAYEWVRENFSEEKTLESWRRMLQELETR